MKDYFIPLRIQSQLQVRADTFLRMMLPKVTWRIIADCRGKFIYLRRWMPDRTWHNLGRMTYSGDENNMPFALFSLYAGKYDTKAEFPAAKYLDGTIEGAIKAVLTVYP